MKKEAINVKPLFKGSKSDIIHTNVNTLKNSGKSEYEATKAAIKKSRPSNLGKFLHPKGATKPSPAPSDGGPDDFGNMD